MGAYVGAQWELRYPLAPSDQWFRHRSRTLRAHVDPLQDSFLIFGVGGQWELRRALERREQGSAVLRVPGAQASLRPIWGGTLQGTRTCAPQPLPSEEDRVLRTFEVLSF